MQRYDLTTLGVQTGSVPKALAAIEAYLGSRNATGRLLAVWTSEIGPLGQVMIIRGFDEAGALAAERDRMLLEGEVFGANPFITGVTMETYAPFPFFAPMPVGQFGPFFEVRVYGMRPAGLAPVIAAWQDAVPARARLSPILLAAYALDGATPRMLHICPYRSLDERVQMRAQSVAAGIWPPKGGPEWMTTLQSTIFLPAKFSPLQ